MTRSARTVCIAAALFAACDSSSTAAPTPVGTPGASCGDRWQATAAWAMVLDAVPTGGLPGVRFPLVSVAGVLDDGGDRATFDLIVGRDRLDAGSEDASVEHLEATLGHVAWRARKLHNLASSAIPAAALGIAPDVSWARVVEITEHLRAAGYDASFLFELPRPVEPPSWSWLQLGHELSQLTYLIDHDSASVPLPYERARRPSEGALLAPVLAPCPELVRRARELPLAASIASWRGYDDVCRCRIDERSLRALLWAMHPAGGSTRRLVHLADPAAAAAPVGTSVIESSADAPWSEVGPRIAALPRGATVQLRVAAP